MSFQPITCSFRWAFWRRCHHLVAHILALAASLNANFSNWGNWHFISLQICAKTNKLSNRGGWVAHLYLALKLNIYKTEKEHLNSKSVIKLWPQTFWSLLRIPRCKQENQFQHSSEQKVEAEHCPSYMMCGGRGCSLSCSQLTLFGFLRGGSG